MAKSSLAIPAAAFLLAWAGPAFALAPEAPLTAERAAEIQHKGLQEAVGTAPCDRQSVTGDIVVCGHRAPYVPLPWEKLPGQRENLLPGEVPMAQSGLDTCVIACQASGVRFDVIRTVKVGSKIVRHILGKDD